jgi:hypothetical protein
MRIPSVLLLPATTACLVLALSGCAGGSGGAAGSAAPSTAAAASAAVDLAGTTWRVTDAEGAASGTTAHFDGSAVTVTSGDGSSSYAWSAQGDQVLVGGSTSGLSGAAPAAWLTRTARVQRDGDGWVLLAADGSRTARLTAAGGSASPAPTTPVSLLQSGTPGPGVGDTAAKALEGRWIVAGSPTSAITFDAGQWRATSSCATGALGGSGAYRVLPGGRLLVVRTATPIRGCPIVQGTPRLRPNAITAIARAASFRVRGDTLQLFDRDGTGLGALVRG